MLAEVIVDVPSQNTDQQFSYKIPSQYENFLEVGMRVTVPFGNGNRLIQGYVTGFSEEILEADVKEKLKEIVEVLDLNPILNQELLALSDYMKEKTFAFKITCLQTMLPSVFKTDYKKFFVPTENLDLRDRKTYFSEEKLPFATVEEKGQLKLFLQWKKENKVEVLYEVSKKNKVKTKRFVESCLNEATAASVKQTLRKGSFKKEQLLTFLGTTTEVLPSTTYQELGFDSSQLKKAEKLGWLKIVEKEVYRDPFLGKSFEKDNPLALTKEQQAAFAAINTSRMNQKSEVFLLEGVTGSGKTEVYLQCIQEALKAKQTALMLVPEIALTPQMVTRFKKRFGKQVAVLHSGLSLGERYDQWRKIQRKEATVVVGARSAIFAPLENLGMIIIDEEHEASYKQTENPRYHARDMAIWRGNYHHCPVVLGSATPSLESRARSQKQVYRYLTLKNRPTKNPLPHVTVVDLKEEFQQGNLSSFSKELTEKIQERLTKKEQIVLLLNRRGYSSFVMCRTCGYVLPCPNCDISLTLHMDIKKMKCHYCGHEENIPHICPQCHSKEIRYYGTGTQKVAEELQELFPEAGILRMDVDTTSKKGAHEKILTAFENHEADILLGTQMIAKGLDYPLVTLVGVLNADTALNLPDFRSGEHTFQLLTQVAGRAGRGDLKGEVIIQTFNPEHYAIALAKEHNYEAFYQKEMKIRHLGGYPPYYYTVQITASHEVENEAAKTIFKISQFLKNHLSQKAVLVGPSPKAILRVKQRYYYQVLIKYKNEPQLESLLQQIQHGIATKAFKGVQVAIDMEPLQFI